MLSMFKSNNTKLVFFVITLFLMLSNIIISVYAINSDYVVEMTFGIFGSREGEFNYPVCIALDQNDNIYVTDWENDQIKIFNSNGELLRIIPGKNSNFQLD